MLMKRGDMSYAAHCMSALTPHVSTVVWMPILRNHDVLLLSSMNILINANWEAPLEFLNSFETVEQITISLHAYHVAIGLAARAENPKNMMNIG